jgi:cyclophilin family peptidyl-prolyl cis-trans isomerase
MSNPIATMDTSMGQIKVEIFLDRVPRTASNFIDLAQAGFYNGLHFHRVIPGFMDQFGCPHSKDPKSRQAGTGGPPDGTFKNLKTGATEKRFSGGNIMDENISRDSNEPGTLSMANTGTPNSGGSQFFLNVVHNNFLDWFSPGDSKHPVFGKVVDPASLEIAIKISKVPSKDDCPVTPVMMKSITITGA